MTSALSDACAWSVGKLKTSAEDWRTGMRLWRPERELAAGHLCVALFTRFFDGMLHAALDPVHGTRKAAIERKARRLKQQAAAQARGRIRSALTSSCSTECFSHLGAQTADTCGQWGAYSGSGRAEGDADVRHCTLVSLLQLARWSRATIGGESRGV